MKSNISVEDFDRLLPFSSCVVTSCNYFLLKPANIFVSVFQTTRVRFVFDEEALVCSLTYPKSIPIISNNGTA